MKHIIQLLGLGCFSLAMVSCEQPRKDAHNEQVQVDTDGYAFLKAANQSGLTEVQASKLALAHASNPRVLMCLPR